MFCTACGSEISLAADSCPSCGRSVAPATVSAVARPTVQRASDSGARLRTAEPVIASLPTEPAPISLPASIHAGDLDLPGFPRDLAGRVSLLTGLVMLADLLLPWVTVNGMGYSPTGAGLPTLALVVALVAVVAPPLSPQLRRAKLTQVAPFGVGALTLGLAGGLWLLSGPLATTLIATLIARIVYVAAPELANTIGGSPGTVLQITPAIGLYVFLLGACTLLVAGYQALSLRES